MDVYLYSGRLSVPALNTATWLSAWPPAGELDWVAAMATVACELHSAFEFYHWTGFYRSLPPPALGGEAAGAAGAAASDAPAARAAAGSAGPAAGEGMLVVGPYQGSLGCLRIPFRWGAPDAAARLPTSCAPASPAQRGPCIRPPPSLLLPQPHSACLPPSCSKGVCGAAARTRQTQLVPDVHAFPGHIACASTTQVRPRP